MRQESGFRTIDIAGAAACLLLTGACYLAGVRPLMERRAEMISVREELAVAKGQAENLRTTLRAAEGMVSRLREQIESHPLRLVEPERVNEQVARLTSLAKSHGLSVNEVKPGKGSSVERFTQVPIALSGTGSYSALARFLHAVHEEVADTALVSMELTGEPSRADLAPSFRCNLVWYAAPAGGLARKPPEGVAGARDVSSGGGA